MDNLRTGVGSPFVCVDSISLIILKAVLSEHDVMLAFEPIAVHMRWTCSSQANNKINIEFLNEQMDKAVINIEKLKDADRDIKYTNGNGADH